MSKEQLDKLKDAIFLATTAHFGQVDKGGKPYINHPFSVMIKMRTIDEKIVAILHDILEDTHITVEQLRNNYKFSEEIIQAIVCLTKRKNETYNKYIERVATNELAMIVKKADLEHNMDLSRLGHKPNEKDLKRKEKYRKAYTYLREALMKYYK